MKFTEGYWALREGYTLLNPTEVRDVKSAGGSLTLYAATKRIARRSDSLNTGMITIELSSPMREVIRVRMYHFKGGVSKHPRFEVTTDRSAVAEITSDGDSAAISAGDLSARAPAAGEWRLDFLFRGQRITGSALADAGYLVGPDGTPYTRERLSLGVGECVYGLGERFTPFVKNGQAVDMWNEDGGTSSELAYKNVPFYLTNRGYGVFVAHPERVSFEVASEVVTKVQFSVGGECLEYYVIGGKTPKDVLRRYTDLTGKPALPPAWSFGLWLSTSFTTDYDEETVNGFIDGMVERKIPLHVFHFDCFWMKEFQWTDLEWDRELFPDARTTIARLKQRGLRICVWINPYIAQKSRLFDEGMEGGYLVKRPDGSVWQWDRWQAGMALVDFTNPAAVRWFQDALRQLIRMGVDCFKTDFGERIPTDVVYADGSDPYRMHNFYPYLYNKAVYELLQAESSDRRAVVFARSATAGGQKFPVHWGGDCSATYESMAESLRGGLSLALSGFGFWSHDISGFEKTATPDLYKRWAAWGLLSSHSRLHGSESYRVPWLFDEESVEVLRFFVRLKCSLMPYLYAAACEASAEGVPMMRAMMIEFPDDPACLYLDRQYMLGGALLVAPILNPEGAGSYYLPEGTWTNFLTGESARGGRWREDHHDYLSIPLWARQGSIIAVGKESTRPDYDYAHGVTFHLFELDEGSDARARIYDIEGDEVGSAEFRRDEDAIQARVTGKIDDWKLCLRGAREVPEGSGYTLLRGPLGAILTPRRGLHSLTVKLPTSH